MPKRYKVIVIGGSAGSFQVVSAILANLKLGFDLPVVLCLHRLKHIKNGFMEALNIKTSIVITEPEDKSPIRSGSAYLAPANYHLMAEIGHTFALSTEEMHKFSRPSIDIAFDTFSYVYRDKMIGIILSGANTDGCEGLLQCMKRGGLTIVQDPAEATVKTMVDSTLKLFKPNHVLKTPGITELLNSL
jgi:two-component system, chemotaxis family, protein-glutamate methylesterase/glutaminase